jgi:CDGSH-type Zn-finger protein
MELRIRCRQSGPFVIEGPVEIVDHQGNAFTLPAGKPAVALCRCGQSKTKPFCDGSHKTCGFVADELAPAPAPTSPT